MKAKLLSFSALVALLAVFVFVATPVRAGTVDEKIKALEEELDRLKTEQIELRKDATEAAAALPSFSYRPGSGILLEAADKSWSIRFHNRIHYWLMFRDGKANDDTGREGLGEVFGRRIRPTFFYCVNDCLYEMEASFDLDSEDAVALQRAATFIHLEKLNPWMPTFYFGLDSPAAWARRRSSSSGAQLDYDILSRSFGNTFSNGWNYSLLWEDKSLATIGIPGRIEWFNLVAGSGPGNGSDGLFVNTDTKSYQASLAISPFSLTKIKWLRGLEVSGGVLWCNFDERASENGGCDDTRMRETDGFTKAVVWDANTADDDVTNNLYGFSARYQVGPYQVLGTYHFARFEDTSIRHNNFYIGHQLYVWSPKGFLTGSSSTPGSILIGGHFERSDGRCGSTCSNDGEFSTNNLKLYSAHLSYFFQRGIRVGVHWNHYDAAKLTSEVQEELDIRNVGVPGRGGSWDNIMVIFGWEF